MKQARKMKLRKQKRIQLFESKMSDPRISSTWKNSANRPGSGKKS